MTSATTTSPKWTFPHQAAGPHGADRPASGPGDAGPAAAVAGSAAKYDADAFVARYAAVWAYGHADPDRTSEPYYATFLDAALPAGTPAPASILDVGCGPGRVIADLADRVPAARCTAIDASATMVRLARQIVTGPRGGCVLLDPTDFGFEPAAIPMRGRPDVEFVHGTLEDYARTGAQHALVVASHLLDRVASPVQALDCLADLVAPGGHLVIGCAFNYEQRSQWTLPDGHAVARQLHARGWRIDHLDDAVSYRERLDIRGTVTSHVVAVVRAGRPRDDQESGSSASRRA